jgi:hypothetical protein
MVSQSNQYFIDYNLCEEFNLSNLCFNFFSILHRLRFLHRMAPKKPNKLYKRFRTYGIAKKLKKGFKLKQYNNNIPCVCSPEPAKDGRVHVVTPELNTSEDDQSCLQSFLYGYKDFRSFGRNVYRCYRDSGLEKDLLVRLRDYEKTYHARKKFKIIADFDQLPLCTPSAAVLLDRKAQSVRTMLELFQQAFDKPSITDWNLSAMEFSRRVSEQTKCSDYKIREWTLDFIRNEGKFTVVSNKRKTPTSIITDESSRALMTKFMLRGARATPTVTAENFKSFVNQTFGSNICVRTAQLWLHDLDFTYRRSTSLEIYKDGHDRPDVLQALQKYLAIMEAALKYTVTYTGDSCNIEQFGCNVQHGRLIISYHDES